MKKHVFILLFSFLSYLSYSLDSCKDSIVEKYNHVECIENTDTLYQWTVPFDSVSIKLIDRWGKVVISTKNPYTSMSKFFSKQKKKGELPIGTYVFFIKT